MKLFLVRDRTYWSREMIFAGIPFPDPVGYFDHGTEWAKVAGTFRSSRPLFLEMTWERLRWND